MSTLPDAALKAASEAFAEVYNDPATMTACITAAVEAAAPLIVADALKGAARKQFEAAIADAAEEATTARLREIEALVRASERARIIDLFDEWIEVCLAEPNHHPPAHGRPGSARCWTSTTPA